MITKRKTEFRKIQLYAGNSANIYWFKVDNKSTRKMREICSKLLNKTPKRRQLSLLALNIFHIFSSVSIVDFEQGSFSW